MSSGGDKQSDWVSPDPEADFNFQNEKQTTIDTDDKPEIDNEDESRIFMNILDGLACLVILLMISTVTFDCLDKSGLKRGAGGGGTSISSTFQSVVFVKSVASATSKAKRKDGEAGNFHVKSAQVCSHLKRRSFALSEALFPEDQYELFLSSMLRNRSRIGEYATKSFPAFSDISADLDNGIDARLDSMDRKVASWPLMRMQYDEEDAISYLDVGNSDNVVIHRSILSETAETICHEIYFMDQQSQSFSLLLNLEVFDSEITPTNSFFTWQQPQIRPRDEVILRGRDGSHVKLMISPGMEVVVSQSLKEPEVTLMLSQPLDLTSIEAIKGSDSVLRFVRKTCLINPNKRATLEAAYPNICQLANLAQQDRMYYQLDKMLDTYMAENLALLQFKSFL